MRISIVIPAFNAERYLGQTIRSVLGQTVRDWELVIVDDGSTDYTAIVARAYAGADPRLRIVQQANHGVAGARNRGFAETNTGTEFVSFLDHDDLWEPEALQTLVAALEADPEAVAASGLSRYIDREGRPFAPGELEEWGRRRQGVVGRRLVAWPLHAPTTLAVLAYRDPIATPGQVLIRRPALTAAGPFDPATAPCDDWDMWLRLSQGGDMAYVDRVVLNWRSHDRNATWQRALMGQQMVAVRRKLLTAPGLSAEQRAVVRRANRLRSWQAGAARLRSARESLARRQIEPAVRQLRAAVRGYWQSLHGIPAP